jgi:hypothetical protein
VYKILGGDGREYGPVTVDQLREWVRQGRADARTLVLREGETGWKPLTGWPEFAVPAVTRPDTVVAAGVPPLPGSAGLPQRKAQTSPMAVTSLVMGLLSIVVCWCSPLFSVLGIIFALMAFSQIKSNPSQQGGKGLAVAGLICSIAGIVFALAVGLVWGLMFSAAAMQH